MVNSCSAYGCKNRNTKGSDITFHRFPLNNKSLLKLWLYQIKRGNWEPSKYSVICSEHFTKDCFVFRGAQNSRRTLKNDAYPTIFSMAIYSEPPKRKFPVAKKTTEDASEVTKDTSKATEDSTKITDDVSMNDDSKESKDDDIKSVEKMEETDKDEEKNTENA